MLGVESKPNDNDRFKTDDKALDKLGYRGLFGPGLGVGLSPAFGTSLSANLTASLSASFGASLINNFSPNDRISSRDSSLIISSNLDRNDRHLPTSCGINGGPGMHTGGHTGGRSSDPPGHKDNCVELVKPSLVYDIASLILYRCHALPIRLKIALDRLFSVLTPEDVRQVLLGFGWTYEDYARGYMLQDHSGSVLHKWNMVTPEEEAILLKQFLRFGETKNIVQQLLQQDSTAARLDRVARDIREARDLRDSREREKDARDICRDYPRERESRDHRERDHREHREIREREHREHRDHHQEVREEPLVKSYSHHSHSKHMTSHHAQQQPPQFPLPLQLPDPNKPLDPEQLKKIMERNMLFNPFMRGTADPSSLLRPPHSTNPHSLPPTSPLTNLLAANPSLASSILANPQLASSLSLLRLPVPAVSLPNISPNNGTLPSSFGGGHTSPMGGSPLNRLQSMQPFDFRKERKTPSPALRTATTENPLAQSNTCPTSIAATSPNSITSGGSVGGTSPSSTVTPMGASAMPNIDVLSPHDRVDNFSDDDDSSSASSIILNLSTTTTTISPASTPIGAGLGPGGMSMPPNSTTPNGNGPSTPPKRSWNPINMGTSLINPVTGKKRVQCNVCLKTFCDKGALKIHFSAVHLREMHKCTVEGCNMMFSSRRSRNRHSANPNPKLHTPHVRRKISPHDGRTSGSHPVMLPHTFQQQLSQGLQPPGGFPPLGAFPPQFGGLNPLSSLPFMPPGTSADLHKQALELQRQSLELQSLGKGACDLSSRGSDESGWRYGHNSINTTANYLEESGNHECLKNNNSDRIKYGDENIRYVIEERDDSMSVDASSFKGNGNAASPSVNKRKRKNQNPTKFAFRLEDDDLISTDDDDDDEDDDDDLEDKNSEEAKNEDKELDAMTDDDEDNLSHCLNERKREKNKTNVKSSNNDNLVEVSNSLRHLEDLSKGNFLGGANGALCPITVPNNAVSSTSPKPSDRGSDPDSDGDSYNEELENNLHYSEGFLSNVTIPSDRENPRRCVACSKIFQNHFGVKIHYQNVHLKLMHKCTIDGCNAAFPSKRSRDRHSTNLNLHRKLLSSEIGFTRLGFSSLPFNQALNPELLARLYSDPTAFSLDALKAQLPTSLADTIFNSSRSVPPLSTNLASPSPFFLHNLLPHLASNNNLKEKSRTPSPPSTTPAIISSCSAAPFLSSTMTTSLTEKEQCTKSHSPIPMEDSAPLKPPTSPQIEDTEMCEDSGMWNYKLEDDLPSPDREGNMPCRFCYQTFDDGDDLKQHYDSKHRKELFKCSFSGCYKLFSSRRKRNSHELNTHNSASETR